MLPTFAVCSDGFGGEIKNRNFLVVLLVSSFDDCFYMYLKGLCKKCRNNSIKV